MRARPVHESQGRRRRLPPLLLALLLVAVPALLTWAGLGAVDLVAATRGAPEPGLIEEFLFGGLPGLLVGLVGAGLLVAWLARRRGRTG